MLRELVLKCRSVRRFYQNYSIRLQEIEELIDTARLTASGGNLQPLKYIISVSKDLNERIFPCLGWAAHLKDWSGPKQGERPSAYIVMLGDRQISDNFAWDQGIAAQTIMLAAVESGYGGCMIGSINKERLRQELELEQRYQILLVLALGKPKEKVLLELIGPDGDIRYYRDAKKVHHVPKRSLEEVLLLTKE